MNVPLWWKMLIMGVAMYMWGQGVNGKPLYLPHNFAMNLKLLLKKIRFFRKNWKKREHTVLHTYIGGCKYPEDCGKLGAQAQFKGGDPQPPLAIKNGSCH